MQNKQTKSYIEKCIKQCSNRPKLSFDKAHVHSPWGHVNSG